ncbi:MAG: helix-turn-helix transcriptional regulator [Clostridium sp.]|nr:helix-turn-helix transcriptional regulator [Clostridium sp.]MCM1171005.1 helix-turn-helix transcriptional regulator [Clostridium sp.]MCM1208017.1 helix-turn-helix transcriptional regulator [Ruminococcus sp.]
MVSIEKFGNSIKKRRKNLGIHQYELAERLDISPNHLSSLETGKTKPSFDLLCKLCIELDVSPDYLMLGSMHPDNVPQNIMDKLKFCSSDTLYAVDGIMDILIEQQERMQ